MLTGDSGRRQTPLSPGNTQLNKNLRQQLVPVIDTLGNFFTGKQKRDIAVIVHLKCSRFTGDFALRY